MVGWFLFLMACTTQAPTPEPDAAPDPEPAAPIGAIGGEPILPQIVVLGGISSDEVATGVAAQNAAIQACYTTAREREPELAGKVLVKFNIDQAGRATAVTTRSSSLRHPKTEACVNEQVAKATFPALRSGKIAIVLYPFVFPTTP